MESRESSKRPRDGPARCTDGSRLAAGGNAGDVSHVAKGNAADPGRKGGVR